MFVVKADRLAWLKRPIWVWAFGPNKTLRGFVFVVLFNGLLQFLLSGALHGHFVVESLFMGTALGATYMLSELPNSFLKRRLGVPAGERSARLPVLFTVLDKSDSSLGVCLFYVLYNGLPLAMLFKLFLLAFGIHLSVSKLLHMLRVKASL
jgi:CDP-diglyceride synthetase